MRKGIECFIPLRGNKSVPISGMRKGTITVTLNLRDREWAEVVEHFHKSLLGLFLVLHRNSRFAELADR